LEASALTQAGRRGLLARRSPLLRLQGDDRLVALLRRGNDHAFEVIVDRYEARLLGFCRQMLGSTEDAEDVLQEVFVNAYRAMRADEREIKLRPWLYRIARNRCLNHLRKPVAEGKDSMDTHPIVDAASTHERVQNREEFRQLLSDVGRLPETQRTALLLREMDAMSYEDIAQTMQTTVPSVKSLLVRARIALAEESQARLLTCGEVRLELAEAAEGLGKATGPVRRHLRECDSCGEFRDQLRTDSKVLAALFPAGPLLLVKGLLLSKLGIGGAGASGGAGAAGAGGAGAGAGGAALGGGAGVGGVGAVGGAIGAKAVAGVVTAAVITAGAAVEVKKVSHPQQAPVAASSTLSPVTGGVAAPTVSAHYAAVTPHSKLKAHRKAVAARQEARKAAAADATTADAAVPVDPAATADQTGKHKGAKADAEAGASTTEPAIAIVVTQSPPASTTITTAPAPSSPGDSSGTDHQPPPPPPADPAPPATTDPPPSSPPPGDEDPPPATP
jgi:RNA polymerase sigma factor (sigma-70 family)